MNVVNALFTYTINKDVTLTAIKIKADKIHEYVNFLQIATIMYIR